MIRWKKQKLIFNPAGKYSWMNSHAQVPTILELKDRYRVYFTSRPKQTLSLIGFVDLDIEDPSKILYEHKDSLLPLGGPGTFDEFGLMPASVLQENGKIYLYYTGWSRGITVPYLNAIGLAISEDDGRTFKKYSEGPIVERRNFEPYSAMSPCVLKENDQWHMWYSSGIGWHTGKKGYEPIYIIKYADSVDGINWQQKNKTVIHQNTEGEANTRPTVVKIENHYHMWFCYRGSIDYHGGKGSYRIGYASSPDLMHWKRDDSKAGIDVSTAGWDSKMVEYPQVIRRNNEFLLFYNGNEFGSSGFGYATGEFSEPTTETAHLHLATTTG